MQVLVETGRNRNQAIPQLHILLHQLCRFSYRLYSRWIHIPVHNSTSAILHSKYLYLSGNMFLQILTNAVKIVILNFSLYRKC